MQNKDNTTKEMDLKSTYKFFWDGQMSSLTLHNRTRDEAIRIAREFGWTELCWYKPKTWGNFMTFYGVKP